MGKEHVSAIGSFSDQKSSVPEDLVKVTWNRLGRMPLPLRTQEGSFRADECFSLRQRRESLSPETGPEWHVSAEAPVDALVQGDASTCVLFLGNSSVFWILLCICSEKKIEDSRDD